MNETSSTANIKVCGVFIKRIQQKVFQSWNKIKEKILKFGDENVMCKICKCTYCLNYNQAHLQFFECVSKLLKIDVCDFGFRQTCFKDSIKSNNYSFGTAKKTKLEIWKKKLSIVVFTELTIDDLHEEDFSVSLGSVNYYRNHSNIVLKKLVTYAAVTKNKKKTFWLIFCGASVIRDNIFFHRSFVMKFIILMARYWSSFFQWILSVQSKDPSLW